MPGQLAADSYEEGQRHPGDYEAQVSQRPIAIHGLEHLVATDRGVTHVPQPGAARHPRRARRQATPGSKRATTVCVIPTYCNNTVIHMPAPADEAADKKMMREAGMRLARSYLREPPLRALTAR